MAPARRSHSRSGLSNHLTGPFSTVGKATVNGAQLYVQRHGDVVAGRRVELVVSDGATAPDRAKRIAQEMIVNDRVAIVCAETPPALASNGCSQPTRPAPK